MAIATTFASCADNQLPWVDYPELDRTNPLLAEWDNEYGTPPFESIKLEHYQGAFDAAIEYARAELKAIVENPSKATFGNTIVALERQGGLLSRVNRVFFPLLSANTSDEMEQIAMDIQPRLTELSNDISLNAELFQRVKSVYNAPNLLLDTEDKKLLENTYKSFARSGAALSDSDKELYRSYTSELSTLSLQFGQNSLAATNGYILNITDPKAVEELPQWLKESLAAEAKSRDEEGWSVSLKYPSYVPFMTYSSSRELKEQLYRAYNSRALGGEWDNSENIRRITELRLKIANLLGFNTYADYALDNRMAENQTNVNALLFELLDSTKSAAIGDYEKIAKYATSLGLEESMQPWDFAYYSEKYKDEHFSVSDEAVKPYFQLDSVKRGVFMLAERLFDLRFTQVDDIEVFHEDVTTYRVEDRDSNFMAILYLDFHPRESKRSGAWMTEFRGSSVIDGVNIRPLVTLTMNFTKPTESTPALLTYDEMTTLLHEFGHGLHSILSQGRYESLNGTNVYRDFVELPSQLFENWGYEKEFLDMWASHYQTGEKMPEELIEKISAARNYNAAYQNVRQIQFGLLDMAWHTLTEPYQGDVTSFESSATELAQITPPVDSVAISPTFTHIFNGGYAAGYYSYKWAEVIEADAFAYFKEMGIFNQEVAKSFSDNILSRGGAEHPMNLYIKFKGAKPTTKALIDRILEQ